MSKAQSPPGVENVPPAKVEPARHSNGSTPPTSNGSFKSTHTASASASTSKPATGTASTSTSSSNLGPGPSRFRGDVPAFNPSSSSPHIYSQQMHQYAPQPPGSSPVYPSQHTQYYPQQPQFIPYGAMPYYPMAVGYPDYSMYPQYPYYAMPGQQFQNPYMTMNGMANTSGNGYVPNRKKHFKTHNNNNNGFHYGNQNNNTNNYSHYNSNYHQNNSSASSLNHTGGDGVQSHNRYSSASTHSLNSKSGENVIQHDEGSPISVPTPKTDNAEMTATAHDTKSVISNENPTVEPNLSQPDVKSPNNLLQAQSGGKVQESTLSPNATHSLEKIESSTDETLGGCHENLPILFNINIKEFEEHKALISKLSEKLLELKLIRIKKLIDVDLGNTYHVDEMRTTRVVDYDNNTDTQEKLGANIPNRSSKTDSAHAKDTSTPKPALNWASLLHSTAKKTKKITLESSSNGTVLRKQNSLESSALPTSTDRYQSLGLSIMSMLFDPDFDLYSHESYKLKARGLTNTGNICYMNAVLQCLIFCRPFNKVLRLLEEKSIGLLGKTSLTPVLDATIEFMREFSTVISSGKSHATPSNNDGIIVGKPLSPEKLFSSLIESPKFQHLKWGQQEDAEEFLVYLLDGLHEDFVKAEATVTIDQMNQLASSYGNKLDNSRANDLRARMKLANRLVNKTGRPTEVEQESKDNDDNGWSEVGGGRKVSSKRVSEVEPSPITSIFGGRFRSVLNIPKSKESFSITIDPYRSISLDISSNDVETIEDALWKLNEVENLPYKNEDGMEVVASKQTYIEDLPEILTLQLKRFSYQHRGVQNDGEEADAETETSRPHGVGKIEKILKNVSFGLDLTVPLESLSPAARNVQQRKYSLTGVIYHHGRYAEGGHYTCDVLREDGKWLRIDDTAVETIHAGSVTEKPEAKDKSAYIFIYQRKSG